MNTKNNFLEILSEKVRLKPDSPLFLSLAEELRKHERMGEAIDALAEGLRNNPNFMAARLKLALWYMEANMPAEAMREAEKILSVESHNINAQKIAFRIAVNGGDKEKALKYAKEILSLRPHDRESIAYVQNNESQAAELASIVTTRDNSGYSQNTSDEGASKNLQQELRQTEILVEQGRFREAAMLCNMILSDYPRDRKAMQKKEEINSLLSLLRRKTETVINRLRGLQETLTSRIFRAIP